MVFKHQHFHETPPEVEAEFPPSATLEGAVSDALASAGGVDASDVTVTASGSEVTLSGTVQLESEVARAEEVALGVAGVATVRNEIRFTRPR
ncbi:BON domain-containing protein [Neorhizobium galegae]|uniref:BON domain-containing protein n=1 Tax=Neorhizobium galegae TaxID=399 RepID=UPI0006229A27|nr:BON domain-containing protein [Neorhizobium galegae]CDZ25915.1 Putative periplasmic or secreted lipoprotein [Neorhizobium galegae bv. officinalis]KAA9388438.1 BON domain-containing protein [Neorhizobium galegae]KAB1114835.1 BON domain-containing protein [Neorhizobium galegae]MCM2497118.1 BON domain-containing protein [Neorhizobium galegae]MCQ1771186.1 BON domain-containing protein [Neorhizobium galegae]